MVNKMKVQSIWLDNNENSKISKLNEDLQIDILIIGGGITGLSTLYQLRNTNLKVCLVESNFIGSGVTGKTTGKINYLQQLVYSDLADKYTPDIAKMYLNSQLLAIKELTNIIKKENIQCNLDKVDSFVYSKEKKEIRKIKKEKNLLESFGIKVLEYNKKNTYAIGASDTYIFHPLKYLYALKEICLSSNMPIYEKTKVCNIKRKKNFYICYANNHTIKTKKVILACHYPFFLLPYLMPLKVYTEKSYITASSSPYKKKTIITSTNPTISIRYHKDNNKKYLIYLSQSSNICDKLNENKNFNKTIKECKKLNLKPSYIWKNDDLITIDKMPYIGSLEKDNNNLLIATGYNTWGMTNATIASLVLKDIILGKDNIYKDIFNPLRATFFNNFDSYMINIGSSIKSYLQNKIFKNKKWYYQNLRFTKINNKDVAIYNDGKDHIVYNKCPHMGCSLVFNEKEKTWDCPCHASRFDIDGKCLKGPSLYDISFNDDKEL